VPFTAPHLRRGFRRASTIITARAAARASADNVELMGEPRRQRVSERDQPIALDSSPRHQIAIAFFTVSDGSASLDEPLHRVAVSTGGAAVCGVSSFSGWIPSAR
jgi:hypothetical protein